MKIKDLLESKSIVEENSFSFFDHTISFGRLQQSYSYEDSLEIFETYCTCTENTRLDETNDSIITKFFLNLESMSTPPVAGEQYITCLLSLVNDKILKTDDIIVGSYIKEVNSICYIEDSTTHQVIKYPRERVGNILMKLFFFEDANSYDKFRNIISLKFGTILPSVQLTEDATAGATSSASIATVVNPHLSPGKARGKKSYTGTPGKSGTTAPPQPKPKNQSPTDNALNMKGASLFGGPAIKR